MDREAELVLQRLDEDLRAVVEGRVDPPLAVVAGNLHPQIARNGEQRCVAGGRVAPKDHDRVTAMTRDVGLGSDAAGVGCVRIDAGPAVGADEQEVLDRRRQTG